MLRVIRECRYAVRTLLKDRGFTAAALLTLAVCLAANSAVFTIVHALLLKPLPVPDGDSILLMSNRYPNAGVGTGVSYSSSGGDYYDRLKAVRAFQEQAAFNFSNQTVEIDHSPQQVLDMAATPSLFRLLQVAPFLGRTFTDDEGEIGNEHKVLLSYGLWQQLYGGDRSAVGRPLRMSGRSYTVVGVMPRGFLFVNPEVRLWRPLAFTPEQKTGHHSNNWYNVGRLKPGATLAQAQAQVNALNASHLEQFPHWRELLINAGFHTHVEPLQDMLVRNVRKTLFLLWGGAGFVLLIGAVNIVNLSIARLHLRRKDLATRLAIGASRAHLAGQLLSETLLLALAGGIGGLFLAAGLLRVMATRGLQHLPRATEIQMDTTTMVFTLGIALVTGCALGLIPLAHILQVNLNTVLRQESRTGTGGRQASLVRQGLVVAQIGFAFVLVAGAGLLLTSFNQLLRVDPGYRTEGIVTASVRFPRARYTSDAQLRALMNRSLEAFRSVPGVTATGATSTIPFGGNYSDSVILAEGYVMKPGESLISPKQLTVTPGYMEALGMRLVRGRFFQERDDENALRVIVIDEQLARKFWSGTDPIGKRMYQPSDINNLMKTDERTQWLTIVGVVRSVRLEDLAAADAGVGAYYFPYAQNTGAGGTFAVKTAGDPAPVASALRIEMQRVDPELALFEIRTMAERAEGSLAPRKTSLLLALGFGVLALFLAAVGIYGVLAYLVTQRNREIGIRMALGSSRAGIFQLLLREGLVLVTTGLALGLCGSVLLRGAIEKQIYGVQALEPVVLAGSIALLGAIAVAACIVPSRRATRVDPVSVLNEQ